MRIQICVDHFIEPLVKQRHNYGVGPDMSNYQIMKKKKKKCIIN